MILKTLLYYKNYVCNMNNMCYLEIQTRGTSGYTKYHRIHVQKLFLKVFCTVFSIFPRLELRKLSRCYQDNLQNKAKGTAHVPTFIIRRGK
jgi:hypothetical protein